ncbi:MAG: SH3 domain-containing protein [Proteobacteria bacterium]|jgi:hypothetical protein|nr:SH3 domain-containing protein [Pseudomonadota bacterium]
MGPIWFSLIFAGMALAEPSGLVAVQVPAAVKQSAGPFSPIVAQLAYGDKVQVLETIDAWARIADASGAELGWVHTSVLANKRTSLKAGEGGDDVSATSDELALAGKGFNSDIEASFRAENQNLDYLTIDAMEQVVISVEEATAFLAEGELKPGVD